MAPSSTEPTTDCREKFLAKLKECTVEAAFGGEYVQLDKLRSWMCDHSYRNIHDLVHQSRSDRDRFEEDPATTRRMTEGQRSCILVFCILLELNAGSLIHHLKKKLVYDSKLPMGLDEIERAFKKVQKDGYNLKQLSDPAKRFHSLQWKYCPLRFELGEEDHDVLAKRVLPICAIAPIKPGGTAHLYQVVVPQEFVNKQLREVVKSSLYDDQVHGYCYVFALKKFKDGNDKVYANEYRAFRALKDNNGMIKCLFGFSQYKSKTKDNTSEDTIDSDNLNYYLVLEYGEYDLWDYFRSYLPPVLETEQTKFWSDLLLVADAIKEIHSFKFSTTKGVKDYCGWHADIKPDNILNVGGEFKMADPGFARFEERPKDGTARVSTQYFGGTTEFGAPECYIAHYKADPQRPISVEREIDIWSLGCVFSVAATWMVYGPAGLDQFEVLRRQAVEAIVDGKPPSTRLSEQKEGEKLGRGGFFHDGEHVLPAVREWHAHLRHGMRNNDIMTERVIQVVEDEMLVSNPNNRRPAKVICQRLRKIIDDTAVESKVQDSVRKALYQTETDWKTKTEEEARQAEVEKLKNVSNASKFRFSSTQSNLGRTTSRLLTGIMQTSHRSKAAPEGSGSKMSPPRILLTQGSRQAHSAIALQTVPESRQHALHIVPPLPPASPMKESSPQTAEPNNVYVAASPVTLTSNPPSKSPQTPDGHRRRTSSLMTSLAIWKKKPKPDEKLDRLYHDRDLSFVVDNGSSMEEYWSEVSRVLGELVSKAQKLEKSSIELVFCNGQSPFKPSKDPAVFAREMNKSDHKPIADHNTRMDLVLGKIMKDYLDHVDKRVRSGGLVRNRTLIVLTDGNWGAMSDNKGVEKNIIEFCKLLKKKIPNLVGEEQRWLSIQFVQFGNDAGATRRLRRLDTKLKHYGAADIVDHKRNDVDPTKILISAVDESEEESEGDDDEEEEARHNIEHIRHPARDT